MFGLFCGNVLIVLEGSQKQNRKIDLTFSNLLIFVGFLLLELINHRNEKSKKKLQFSETVPILLLFTRPYRNFTLKFTDVRLKK